jgi:uncharacterized SAM-binding protein YcdF (DUF218 family)
MMVWGRRLVLVIAAAWLVAFALFLRALPNVEASLPIAAGDGIVVPTGGYARVATGLDLLAESGGRLLITGVYPNTSLAAVLVESGREQPACCIDLDYEASNTAGNAAAAARWATQFGLKRVHLVTSWYHMPRSLLLFRRALPGITVIPRPVFPPDWSDRPWWQSFDGWRLAIVEFGKYVWVMLLPAFDWEGRSKW